MGSCNRANGGWYTLIQIFMSISLIRLKIRDIKTTMLANRQKTNTLPTFISRIKLEVKYIFFSISYFLFPIFTIPDRVLPMRGSTDFNYDYRMSWPVQSRYGWYCSKCQKLSCIRATRSAEVEFHIVVKDYGWILSIGFGCTLVISLNPKLWN